MSDGSLDYALATFHDATLLGLSVDWIAREAILTVLTNDDGPPRKLLLRAKGLAWLTMDPPTLERARGYEYTPSGGPWIDAMAGVQGDGAPSSLAASAPQAVTIFVNNWNSFIWIGADSFVIEEAP